MIVYKNNNRYGFKIGGFDSSSMFFIFPHVKSSYKFAWQAERDGRKILSKMRSVIAGETDAEETEPFDPSRVESAEDMIVTHYLGAYDELVDKTDGVVHADEDIKKKVYEEIKIVVQNLLKIQEQLEEEDSKIKIEKIIGKFSRLTKNNFNDFLKKDREEKDAAPPEAPMPMGAPAEMPGGAPPGGDPSGMPPMPPIPQGVQAKSVRRYLYASADSLLTKDEEHEILEDSAQKACMALESRFPDAIYMIDPSKNRVTIASCDRKIKYVTMIFDSNLLLSRVLPHSFMPVGNSGYFYQSIFKPIFESVGHFKVASKGILMVNGKTVLPDLMETDTSVDVDAIDTETKQPCATTISFSNKRWKAGRKMEKSASGSKYTEMDYTNNGGAIVECIDQELESIFGKRGVVQQVIPSGESVLIYVDVNFGNAIVRLTEQQIKIVNDEVQTPQ